MRRGICPRILVIGIGTRDRADDGAGPLVVERLRGRVGEGVDLRSFAGGPLDLLNLWGDAPCVVLVDAVRSGAPAGTVHRVDLSGPPLPFPAGAPSSTHALGLAEAVELGRRLGLLPVHLHLVGVEGIRWDHGAPPSPEVLAALDDAAAAVLELA